eukprot:TRINITY_DN2291_c0_g1_i2.p1 TRINITY_DN2291_c0_g1~~TRINITY_DN2291_c0_g1_i2.p1  ORF type:complete len:731 (+),score=293.97 TRINITY_DN2291_c0_g1_i2:271-2193(+)
MADVVAAKARMFVNKPDGMVREVKGPFTDPSHPYMYEEEDLWMAPGFIKDYYPVPKVWERHVEEVDKERMMWLHSFYHSPLRLPMPPELEYLWDQDEEFVVLGNEPSLDGPITAEKREMATRPELQGDVLLHVPTRQIINWAEDPMGRLRFFIQPLSKDGKVDPALAKPLPLGFKEFLEEGDEAEGEEEEEKVEGGKKTREQKLRESERKAEKQRRKWAEADRRRWARRQREAELAAVEEAKRAEEEKQQQLLQEAEAKREDALEDAEFNLKLQQLELEKERIFLADEEAEEEEEEATAAEEEEVGAKVSGRKEKPKEREVEEDAEEDEDEEDDDKKPRSFGTVAMADWRTPSELAGKKQKQEKVVGGRPTPGGNDSFPTVFASISMALGSSQTGILNALLAKLPWRIHGRMEEQRRPSLVPSPSSSSAAGASAQIDASSSFFSPLKQVNCRAFTGSSRAGHPVRLRTTFLRKFSADACGRGGGRGGMGASGRCTGARAAALSCISAIMMSRTTATSATAMAASSAKGVSGHPPHLAGAAPLLVFGPSRMKISARRTQKVMMLTPTLAHAKASGHTRKSSPTQVTSASLSSSPLPMLSPTGGTSFLSAGGVVLQGQQQQQELLPLSSIFCLSIPWNPPMD